MPIEKQNWELEFDEQFSCIKETDAHYYNPWLPDVKSFIKTLLLEREKELYAKVKELKVINCHTD